MKKIRYLFLLIGLPYFISSQNVASRVIEYKPAPGQHINIEQIGTPQAAEKIHDKLNNSVSLGGFGGYIILGFNEACVNNPQNPFGIDFTIFGNAFNGSTEPGIVWVMKDENRNGEPDDTWYEIKGSRHFHSKTIENYQVTYFKTDTRNVNWEDNKNNSGILKANNYNLQEYYPSLDYFTNYPQDSVTFNGTFLEATIDSSNNQQFVIRPLDFGYADNHPIKQGVELTAPDNPYTTEIEGVGGDPFDISWAVDSEGNYVELDSIHFIKIVTGNRASVGWLGEISTDVSYVVDVQENSEITGENKLLVLQSFNPKITIGKSFQLEANFFEKGRLKETAISYSSQNETIAQINSSGLISAKNIGETEIIVSANGKTKSTIIIVVAPDSIDIKSDFSAVYEGDSILLEAAVFDNLGDLMHIKTIFSNLNPELGRIIQMDEKFYFVAEHSGKIKLKCTIEGFSVEKQFSFNIWSESDLIDVYFTMKTETENLLPLQKIKVGLSDLNQFVENRKNDYSGATRHFLSHALLAGLQKAEIGFKFRDDESSDFKMYLYSVENDGEYTYGWGGKTNPQAFSKSWIARLNSNQFLNHFNEIEIANGDTIVLYHVSDISNSWIFTRMIADMDSANINYEIEITLEKATCSLLNDSISETNLIPISNQEIIADKSYFSDELGKAFIRIESQPPFVIKSGNDAVLIAQKIITSSNEISYGSIQVYPNPIENTLYISSTDSNCKQLYIYNLSGIPVYSKNNILSNESIDFHNFNPGVYVLKIGIGSSVETFKLIKK